MLAHDMALAEGGEFLLRIEDIDQSRARPEWEDLIYEDLRWLGLSWEEPVMRQSERLPAYAQALDRLWQDNLLYPCSCTRRDIAEALGAPQEGVAPTFGPDGPVYPGTCRPSRFDRVVCPLPRPSDMTLRLWMEIAAEAAFEPRAAFFTEEGHGPEGQHGLVSFDATEARERIGDIVLARRDMGTSYHLSVVVDDAAQDITHVVRGEDLFEATKIHVMLQGILGLQTPTYHHHRLIRDEHGKRLAKRDDARAIRKYREDGATPRDIRRMVGL